MKKGEIYFRKSEKETLEELLATQENCIISLGGGTPVYYNNMEILNNNSITIYLRANIGTLVQRLSKQKKRPLIARISDEDLLRIYRQTPFERNIFYNKAQYVVDTDQNARRNSREITTILQLHP